MLAPNPAHHWLALTQIPKLGGATLRRLLPRFDRLESLFRATPSQLATVVNLPAHIATALPALSLEQASHELQQLNQQGITPLHWDDRRYPKPLFELRSPPPVLFVKGDWQADMPRSIAIVGSRRVSQRSRALAYQVAAQFAAAGWAVVSGLALGIDTAAHQGALSHPHGRTVAVLGSGLHRLYPAENRPLAQAILKRGAILSEQRPHVGPDAARLMARNRLIAALSQAVIVIEASGKSGALETARQADRLGRPVFALPGSPGTDQLLRGPAQPFTEAATLCETVRAVLNAPSSAPWKQGKQASLW